MRFDIFDNLAKYKSWERLDKSIRPMFGGDKKSGEGNFQKEKKEGVGRKVIKSFLGDNWKDWQIQDALVIKKVFPQRYIDIK